MKRSLKFFVHLQLLASDRRGGTLIEYCLLAGLIAIGLVGALSTIGENANSMFQSASDGFGA